MNFVPMKSARNFMRRFYEVSFEYWQKLGFHITPNHYYWPIPDTRMLTDDMWKGPSSLIGINMNDEGQLDLLERFLEFKTEFELFPKEKTTIPHQYYLNNGYFEVIDGAILYTICRHFKPKRILEIGSGFSTYLSARALIKNETSPDSEVTVVDPYPNPVIKKGFPGLSRVIAKKVQDIQLCEFETLGANDILFIDSSHVLKMGGDVQYLFLEVLPRLKKGVIVHVHDIFLPRAYPKEWVLQKFMFWTEQYLLQAFLTFNDSYDVMWAGSYMNLKHYDTLKRVFGPLYERKGIGPGSFWMQKTK